MTDPALPEILLSVGTLRHCDSKSGASLRRSLPSDIISVLEQDFWFGNLNEIYKASVESVICGGCNWVGWKVPPCERKHCSTIGQQTVDLPISVRSASLFLSRDSCFPLNIVLMVRGGEETFSTAQRVLDSSHNSVFCLTAFQ